MGYRREITHWIEHQSEDSVYWIESAASRGGRPPPAQVLAQAIEQGLVSLERIDG